MDIWRELALAPTRDMAAIRRAYAARLRTVRPESDAAGFTLLRAAYEQAMRQARPGAPAPRPSARPVEADEIEDEIDDDVADRPQARPTPVIDDEGEPEDEPEGEPEVELEVDREPRETRAAPVAETVPPPPEPAPSSAAPSPAAPIAAAMAAGDAERAATLLIEARDRGTLSLAEDIALADQLAFQLIHDEGLEPAALAAAARHMGWPDATMPARTAGALQERLAAEAWRAQLSRSAGSWTRLLGRQGPAAARLLLGRGRVWGSWILPPDPPLRRLFAEYRLHEGWIGHAFDPGRIETVARLLTGRYTRRAPTLFAMLLFVPMLVGAAVVGHGAPVAGYVLLMRLRRGRRGVRLAPVSSLLVAVRPMLLLLAVLAVAFGALVLRIALFGPVT